MRLILISRIIIPLLFMAMGMALHAQTGSLMRQAAELASKGKDADARLLWLQVWNNHQASPYARIEAGGLTGESLFNSGAYEDAIKMFYNTLALADSVNPELDAASALRYNTALHLMSLGRFDDARNQLDKLRLKDDSEIYHRSRAHLAEIESRTGNHERAIEILDSLYDNIPDVEDNKSLRAAILQNRAFILLESGDEVSALPDFRKALNMVSGLEQMIIMSNLALAESLNEECGLAEKHIDTSLKFFLDNLGENSFDYINALRKKAVIAGRCGNTRLANNLAMRFLSLEKERVLSELPEMSESTRLNYWLKEKPLLTSLFTIPSLDAAIISDAAIFRRQVSMLGIRDVNDLSRNIGLNTRDVCKWLPKGGILLQLIEYQDENGIGQYDAVIVERNGKCSRIPLFSEDYIMSVPLSTGVSTLYDAVTGDEFENINALYSDKGITAKIWEPILKQIPENTEKIYFVPEGIFHLWGIENMPLPENMPGAQRLSSVYALKETSKSFTLPDDTRTIVAGGLDYSHDENEDNNLIPDHTSYDLLIKTLGVKPGSEIFTPLPATRIEADTVAAILGENGALHYLHEGDFKQLAPYASLIHLATHGYTLFSGIGTPPRFIADTLAIDMSLHLSGIALSGANRSGINHFTKEDGILSAREIAALDLHGVDMVVLSACQTGRGTITDEGVSGLVRALKMAGVGTIVASLWEVDDNATRLFMQYFYQGMAAGNSRSEAFSLAKKKVAETESRIPVRHFNVGKMHRVNSGETRVFFPYRSPYYHSAFILID